MVLRGGKMNREPENQKEFLKNLDRILAGEKIETTPTTDDDLSSLLAFAQKIVALRVPPSPEFKFRLKAGLLRKLTEQEEAARRNTKPAWFEQFRQHQLIWQTITAVLVVTIIGGILWGTGLFKFSGRPPVTSPVVSATSTMTTTTTTVIKTTVPQTTTATVARTTITTTTAQVTTSTVIQPAPIQAKMSTDKASYADGESVSIQIALTNVTANSINIDNFPPSISLMRSDMIQPVYTFTSGYITRTIEPHQTTIFTITWKQQDAKGNAVAPGVYNVKLEDLKYQGQTIRFDLANPVSFTILPPTSQ
jgi:hypothetical protein